MERIEPFSGSRQRFPNPYLFGFLDFQQGELDILRKYLIVVSYEYGVAPEQMRGKFASHNHRILQQNDTELL
jgi:hypothetical protein